jgi:hypothetical protein
MKIIVLASIVLSASLAVAAPTNHHESTLRRRLGAACMGALLASQPVAGRLEPTRPNAALEQSSDESAISRRIQTDPNFAGRVCQKYWDEHALSLKTDESSVTRGLVEDSIRRKLEEQYMRAPTVQLIESQRPQDGYLDAVVKASYHNTQELFDVMRQDESCCFCESAKRGCWCGKGYDFSQCCCCSTIHATEGGCCDTDVWACRCCDTYCAAQCGHCSLNCNC